MGNWNIKITESDAFQDIYRNFFDLYNQGQSPVDISKQIQEEFDGMFKEEDEGNNALFGLAFAQWETKSLDPAISKKVKEIIETGRDIEVWKGLGADEKTLKQRKTVIDKFLIQISVEREKPKRRVQPTFEYETINLVNEIAPDNLKKFRVNEEYTNKNYIHTSGIMEGAQGGDSIIYFTGQGKSISAKWLDRKTLDVIHDRDIVFMQQDDKALLCGDSIKINYKAQ